MAHQLPFQGHTGTTNAAWPAVQTCGINSKTSTSGEELKSILGPWVISELAED
jgi:hypothetical protein